MSSHSAIESIDKSYNTEVQAYETEFKAIKDKVMNIEKDFVKLKDKLNTTNRKLKMSHVSIGKYVHDNTKQYQDLVPIIEKIANTNSASINLRQEILQCYIDRTTAVTEFETRWSDILQNARSASTTKVADIEFKRILEAARVGKELQKIEAIQNSIDEKNDHHSKLSMEYKTLVNRLGSDLAKLQTKTKECMTGDGDKSLCGTLQTEIAELHQRMYNTDIQKQQLEQTMIIGMQSKKEVLSDVHVQLEVHLKQQSELTDTMQKQIQVLISQRDQERTSMTRTFTEKLANLKNTRQGIKDLRATYIVEFDDGLNRLKTTNDTSHTRLLQDMENYKLSVKTLSEEIDDTHKQLREKHLELVNGLAVQVKLEKNYIVKISEYMNKRHMFEKLHAFRTDFDVNMKLKEMKLLNNWEARIKDTQREIIEMFQDFFQQNIPEQKVRIINAKSILSTFATEVNLLLKDGNAIVSEIQDATSPCTIDVDIAPVLVQAKKDCDKQFKEMMLKIDGLSAKLCNVNEVYTMLFQLENLIDDLPSLDKVVNAIDENTTQKDIQRLILHASEIVNSLTTYNTHNHAGGSCASTPLPPSST